MTGSRLYWTGYSTKKYWFSVCCLKIDVIQFLNIFSANEVAILCSVELLYWVTRTVLVMRAANIFLVGRMRCQPCFMMFYEDSNSVCREELKRNTEIRSGYLVWFPGKHKTQVVQNTLYTAPKCGRMLTTSSFAQHSKFLRTFLSYSHTTHFPYHISKCSPPPPFSRHFCSNGPLRTLSRSVQREDYEVVLTRNPRNHYRELIELDAKNSSDGSTVRWGLL